MAISREGTYLTSECDRSTRVGGTRRNKLPTVKEDGCLVAVVENRGHFEVVVEVVWHVTFADTACKVGINGISLVMDLQSASGRMKIGEGCIRLQGPSY